MTNFTKKHGNALLMEGRAILLLGILAILLPSVATLGIGLVVGINLAVYRNMVVGHGFGVEAGRQRQLKCPESPLY